MAKVFLIALVAVAVFVVGCGSQDTGDATKKVDPGTAGKPVGGTTAGMGTATPKP